jgi:hypothetical protein
MNETEIVVTVESDGERLCGKLGLPSGLDPGERRAGIVVMHGFGGNMEDFSRVAAPLLRSLGYVTLRFDFRGCGRSTGMRGLVLIEDEVADALNAVSFLEQRPEVDPERIGALGGSLAGSVAVMAAAKDKRVAACISCGGIASAETWFPFLHPAGEARQRFETMVTQGRSRRDRAEKMMVPRFDIVPIPPALRPNLPCDAVMDFPFEVVEDLLKLKTVDVVGRIAPRPLLFLHPASDPVVPVEESIELFRHAGQPADLHVISNDDHFMITQDNWIAWDIMKNWLKKHFPAYAARGAAVPLVAG